MSVGSGAESAIRERFRLPCGCEMEIARDRMTATTLRTIHRRDQSCGYRTHWPGARVYLWELLPPPGRQWPSLAGADAAAFYVPGAFSGPNPFCVFCASNPFCVLCVFCGSN